MPHWLLSITVIAFVAWKFKVGMRLKMLDSIDEMTEYYVNEEALSREAAFKKANEIHANLLGVTTTNYKERYFLKRRRKRQRHGHG